MYIDTTRMGDETGRLMLDAIDIQGLGWQGVLAGPSISIQWTLRCWSPRTRILRRSFRLSGVCNTGWHEVRLLGVQQLLFVSLPA